MPLPSLTRNEWLLALGAGALLLVALFAPALAQPPHAHDFADQRAWLGLLHALDVLSNLPFALAGLLGLRALRAVPAAAMSNGQRICARLFFAGLLVVTVGSSWYHLAPNDLDWSLVLLAYACAKLLEANDQAFYAAAGELLSGHSLKHVAAACAAWPLIHAVRALVPGQNVPQSNAAHPAHARRA